MKKIVSSILKFGTIAALLASILPSLFPNTWFIDIFSNFKLQLIIVSVLLFILNLFSNKSKTIGAILLIITVWNASFIHNLYDQYKFVQINKLRGTTIASINLLSSNNESKKVIDFIKTNNPDVLILLEYNSKWEKLLLETTSTYQFKKAEVRNDNFGIGYFSKIESEMAILNFDHTRVPSIKADLKINEQSLTIIATHPFPPVGQEMFESRNAHLKTLAKMRQEFSENLIVVGDLNTSSYSHHFQTLLSATNLKDSRNGFGILPTWPSNIQLLQTTLDHFLVSNTISVMRRGVGTNIDSDHLPILMEFRIDN